MNKTEPICSKINVTLVEKCTRHKLNEHLLRAHVVLATENVKANKVSFLLPVNKKLRSILESAINEVCNSWYDWLSGT